MSAQCLQSEMWWIFQSPLVIVDIVQVYDGRKHPFDNIMISKYSPTSISNRNMVVDPTCLDIWIFMIYIWLVSQSIGWVTVSLYIVVDGLFCNIICMLSSIQCNLVWGYEHLWMSIVCWWRFPTFILST